MNHIQAGVTNDEHGNLTLTHQSDPEGNLSLTSAVAKMETVVEAWRVEFWLSIS